MGPTRRCKTSAHVSRPFLLSENVKEDHHRILKVHRGLSGWLCQSTTHHIAPLPDSSDHPPDVPRSQPVDSSPHLDLWDPSFFQDLTTEMEANVISTEVPVEHDTPAIAEVSLGLIHNVPN